MTRRLKYIACGLAPMAVLGSVAGASPVSFTTSHGGNNHSYEVIVDAGPTRNGAQAAAESVGGYLVTITSAAEQAFVESLLVSTSAPTGSYWMGLELTGGPSTYRWVSGEAFDYQNFANGEPNNYPEGETASQMYWAASEADDVLDRRGGWNDAPFEGFPDGGSSPDLRRAGFIVERDFLVGGDDGGGPPTAIPLPPAVLAAPLTLGIAGLVSRRRRRCAG